MLPSLARLTDVHEIEIGVATMKTQETRDESGAVTSKRLVALSDDVIAAEQCDICFDDMGDPSTWVRLCVNQHAFHIACINAHLRSDSGSRCPSRCDLLPKFANRRQAIEDVKNGRRLPSIDDALGFASDLEEYPDELPTTDPMPQVDLLVRRIVGGVRWLDNVLSQKPLTERRLLWEKMERKLRVQQRNLSKLLTTYGDNGPALVVQLWATFQVLMAELKMKGVPKFTDFCMAGDFMQYYGHGSSMHYHGTTGRRFVDDREDLLNRLLSAVPAYGDSATFVRLCYALDLFRFQNDPNSNSVVPGGHLRPGNAACVTLKPAVINQNFSFAIFIL